MIWGDAGIPEDHKAIEIKVLFKFVAHYMTVLKLSYKITKHEVTEILV